MRYDNSLDSVAGDRSTASNDTDFVGGQVSESVHVGSSGYIRYDGIGNIAASEDTLEFWIQPDWNGNQDTTSRTFFQVGNNFNDGMLLGIDGANNLRFIQWGDDPDTPSVERHVEKGLHAPGADWRAGEWYHLAVVWSGYSRQMAFYVNGQMVDSRDDGCSVQLEMSTWPHRK